MRLSPEILVTVRDVVSKFGFCVLWLSGFRCSTYSASLSVDTCQWLSKNIIIASVPSMRTVDAPDNCAALSKSPEAALKLSATLSPTRRALLISLESLAMKKAFVSMLMQAAAHIAKTAMTISCSIRKSVDFERFIIR